uniref:G-protein coupled receptors family 3 profile domain-containing protein n=1 Tax=Plectus sambesii TaxID=2011161 RepID=A0A914WBZ0_9BILA
MVDKRRVLHRRISIVGQLVGPRTEEGGVRPPQSVGRFGVMRSHAGRTDFARIVAFVALAGVYLFGAFIAPRARARISVVLVGGPDRSDGFLRLYSLRLVVRRPNETRGSCLPNRRHQSSVGARLDRDVNAADCSRNYSLAMRAKLAAAVLAVVQLLKIAVVDGAASKRGGLCNVFDPFRVQPDSAKVRFFRFCCTTLISALFAHHISACGWVCELKSLLSPAQSLLSLDPAVRARPVSVSQSARRLIAPTDRSSAEALATLLSTARLPVAAYSTVAADALTDAGIKNVLSSAPSIDTYLQTFVSLMNHFESNLVTLVYSPTHIRSIDRIVAQLRNASVFIAETTQIKAGGLGDVIAKSDASIVLSLLDRDELMSALALDGVQTLNKLWVNVPANGYGLSAGDQLAALSKGAHLQLISIQPRLKDLPQFREYFLGVLQSNYQSYSLLTSYVQQVFNCSLIGTPGFTSCEELDRDHMASMFEQAPGVQAVVRTTYALAAIGSYFEKNRAARLAWLLLFFIIAVQLALSLQWLVGRASSTIMIEGDRMTLMCSWGAYDFLWSQVYVVLLLLLALFVASLNRNIKRNYKETKWLFSAALLCVPIWVMWVVGYALVPLPFKNTVVVVELLACATVLLCFLFGPKLYILLSYEPVLIEFPPQTAQTSTLQAAGKENSTAALRYDLFERDEDEPINRAVSPASSTGASTHSTALSQSTSSGGGGGDQSPMFKAAVRRKSRSKRTKDGKDSVARRYPLAVHSSVSARLA